MGRGRKLLFFLARALANSPPGVKSSGTSPARFESCCIHFAFALWRLWRVWLFAMGEYLAPHTNGPRDVPQCGALSLLQTSLPKEGFSKSRCSLKPNFWDLVRGAGASPPPVYFAANGRVRFDSLNICRAGRRVVTAIFSNLPEVQRRED
jgi:hypothetical protein